MSDQEAVPDEPEQKKLEANAPGQVDIHFNQKEAEQSVFPIQWCVSRDLWAWLSANGVLDKNPHLLVTFTKNNAELRGSRKLYPLDAQMTYLSFTRAGDHEIHAAVVWDETGNVPRLKKKYASIRDYDYECSIFNSDGQWYKDSKRRVGHSATKVTIDEKLFAKKPSKALAWFGNHLFGAFGPPRDQCAFRKRLIFALVAMPPYLLIRVPIEFVIRFAVWAFWLALGMRYINHKALLPMGPWSISDIYETKEWSQKLCWLRERGHFNMSMIGNTQWERSFFTCYHDKKKGIVWRPLWFGTLMPMFIMVVVTLATIIQGLWDQKPLPGDGAILFASGFAKSLNTSILIALSIPVIIIAIELIYRAVVKIALHSWPTIKKIAVAAKKYGVPIIIPTALVVWAATVFIYRHASKAIMWFTNIVWKGFAKTTIGQRFIRWCIWQIEIDGHTAKKEVVAWLKPEPIITENTLVCDGKPRQVGLASIPASKRTLVLRFQDLKAKVCKPFAQ